MPIFFKNKKTKNFNKIKKKNINHNSRLRVFLDASCTCVLFFFLLGWHNMFFLWLYSERMRFQRDTFYLLFCFDFLSFCSFVCICTRTTQVCVKNVKCLTLLRLSSNQTTGTADYAI